MHHLFQFIQAVGTDGSLMVDECVHQMASLKEITDDELSHQVVVHGIVATLAQ